MSHFLKFILGRSAAASRTSLSYKADHLYEGRYTPTNAYGKRESCNVYAQSYEECEIKLEEMIARKRAEIAAEKARLKEQASA